MPQADDATRRILDLKERVQEMVRERGIRLEHLSPTDAVTDLLPLVAEAFEETRRSTVFGTSPAELIAAECDALKALLLAKNAAYGNSALDPIRVFSRADAIEQIKVRLDDKLSRIARADPNALGEDAELDALGYLVLLRVAKKRNAATASHHVRAAVTAVMDSR